MARLRLLPILVIALGCSDVADPTSSLVDPLVDLTAAQPAASASAEKWQFEATATFVGTLQPEEVRITPSGVIHGTDLVNEFEVTGDLEGTFYFIGKYHINSRNGKGRSIPFPALLEITSPGSGAFECRGSTKIEGFPAELVQYGTLAGCTGRGDYDGMSMKVWLTNEANPGINVYAFNGEVW